ncbi:MAG: hypothetical protein FWE66_05065 [Oscillospiraceae bacterium]|nr:hypothetical protein [Oscillospiraceae bacterium]
MGDADKNGRSVKERDGIFDLSGNVTGLKADRKLIVAYATSVVIFFIFAYGTDLGAYGPMASKGIGLFAATVVLMIFSVQAPLISILLMLMVAIAMGFFDWQTVGAYIGRSQFYTMLGMTMVAMGAENTAIGKRLAYQILIWFSKKPFRLLMTFGIVTGFISFFISNTATLILMSSIAATLLKAMDEKPGRSQFGKAMMLLVVVVSFYSGSVMISSSPVGNTMSLSMLELASGGEYTVGFNQWAVLGVCAFLIIILPLCFIYVKALRVDFGNLKIPPKEYFQASMKALGPVGGSELRWIIIVLAMIAFMLFGQNSAHMAMLFALICVLPVIGVMPINTAVSRLPILVLLGMGLTPVMVLLIQDTGASAFLGEALSPLLNVGNPVLFSIICCLINGLQCNLLVNASISNSLIAIATPICIACGYNPSVVLLSMLMVSSMFWCMGMNQIMMMAKGYGFWEDKDALLPGFIAIIFVGVALPVIICALAPALGFSLYI